MKSPAVKSSVFATLSRFAKDCAGNVTIIPISAAGLDCAGLRRVDVTGLAAVAP